MPQPGRVGAAVDKEPTDPMNIKAQRYYPVGDAPAPQQSRLPVRSVPRSGGRPSVSRPVNVALKSRMLPSADEKAIQLARRAIEKALGDGSEGVTEVTVAGRSIRQGITIDLSHNNLYGLPDEAIDIINQNIERLAMSHNRISVLPHHISLCTSLRYLNVRSNAIEVFPSVLCDLECLEILDLSRNRLRGLPDDMAQMSSLKVLAVEKNAISDIPVCIAEMTALLALKIDGNPLKPMLRRIVDANLHGSTPKNIRGNEDTDVTITYQIKQLLRNEAKSRMYRTASEKSLGSGEDTDSSQHSSKRSRGGRFPIKVNSDDDQPSRPSNVLAKSHSKAFSLQNHSLWSAGTIPLALDERERSQQVPDGWKGHVQNVHSQALRPGATLNKRYGVQQLPGLPTTDGISQHLRGLSLSAAMSPTQIPESEEQTRGLPEELVDVVPIFQSNTQHDPLLDMARTVYFTIHRPHWLVQALSSLTNDGNAKRSSLEMVVYNADFHLHELGRQIQNYATQSHDRTNAMNQVQRACAVLIKAYIPICAQISRSVDMLVEKADARFVHHFLYLLYSSIMGLRAEFLRSMQEPVSFDRTIKPRRRIEPDSSPTRQESPMTPPPSASRSTLSGEHEAFDQLCFAVSRLCRLIPETLPAINQRFLITVDYMTAQDSAPHIIETWQSAATASFKIIELSEALSDNLPSTKRVTFGVSLRDLCYRFIDAWAAFGNILKSSKSQFGLEPDLRKRLQQIQQAVKEVMNRLVAFSPTTATIPAFAQPASPSPFIPLTPRQGSIRPAIKGSLTFSP